MQNRLKLGDVKVWGVHDGLFHADDVFSGAMIQICNPNATPIRSRNAYELEACDIVIDVGGGYYDHHSAIKVYRPLSNIPYCGFGLLWRDYAEQVIQALLPNLSEDTIIYTKQRIDYEIVTFIDGMDNGINLLNDKEIHGTLITLPVIISLYNLLPQQGHSDNYAYLRAVEFAKYYLITCIKEYSGVQDHLCMSHNVWFQRFLYDASVGGKLYENYRPPVQMSTKYTRHEEILQIVENLVKGEKITGIDVETCTSTVLKKLSSSVIHAYAQQYKKSDLAAYFSIPTLDFVFNDLVCTNYLGEFLELYIRREIAYAQSKPTIQKAYLEAQSKGVNYIFIKSGCLYDESLRELDPKHTIHFVVYFQKEGERYCAGGVTSDFSRFDAPSHFPFNWGGLSGEKLQKVSGIKSLQFCHSGCTFIVAKTLEGILQGLSLAKQF